MLGGLTKRRKRLRSLAHGGKSGYQSFELRRVDGFCQVMIEAGFERLPSSSPERT